MDEQQIQEIVNRVTEALHSLAPDGPQWWDPFAVLTPLGALTAAVVAAVIGWRNLKGQERALRATVRGNEKTLRQRSEADARSEWWRRTQWALDATTSDNTVMYQYGVGMLDILARSELAGAEEARLLQAVAKATSTGMQEESIRGLVQRLSDIMPALSPEEADSVRTFGDIDVPSAEGENEEREGGTNDRPR